MAKKFRKTVPRKPRADGVAADAVEQPDEEEEETAADAVTPPTSRPGTSPLVRSQEVELEVGLTLMGAVVGGLTGFSHVPLGASMGDVGAAALGTLLGASCGLCLGRTLFLSLRAQWFVWGLLGLLSWGGYHIVGLPGAVAGSFATTGIVLYGLRPLALMAERARPQPKQASDQSEGS